MNVRAIFYPLVILLMAGLFFYGCGDKVNTPLPGVAKIEMKDIQVGTPPYQEKVTVFTCIEFVDPSECHSLLLGLNGATGATGVDGTNGDDGLSGEDGEDFKPGKGPKCKGKKHCGKKEKKEDDD